MKETEPRGKKDNILKKVVRHPLTPLVPGLLLFIVGTSGIKGNYDRMDKNASNVFPDVASGQQLTQAKHEIIVFHQRVDEQVRQGNLIVNVSQIADQQRIKKNLDLLAEQRVRTQERKNFRENLRPIKDKRFLIDIGVTLGGLGLLGVFVVRAVRTPNRRTVDQST